jgi:broad specificity phosphatase PhoE
VVAAAAAILDVNPSGDVVLVGHGTAWTLLRAALSGEPPDLDAWTRLSMPDVLQYEAGDGLGDMLVP